MGSSGFVHLHTHTEYSLLDGASRIKDIVQRACECEMPALAITDHGVMYGNIAFYSEARAAGIKPILGCEVYVAPRSRTQRDPRLDKDQYHLVLLAISEKGYKNLIKLVSTAHSDGLYYKPRVDKELLASHSEDLIALSACLAGEVPTLLMRNDLQQAERSVSEYVEIFGRENFYLELQDHGLPEQRPVNEALVRLASSSGIGLVCTNDIHYTAAKDNEAHDALLCIQTGSTLDNPDRFRFGSDQFYFKTPQEMAKLFAQYPESLANTLEIADRCNVELDFGRSKLPDPGVPADVRPEDHMRALAWDGLRRRLDKEPPEDYRRQFDYECDIIGSCGFALYMLIVSDFTDFARRQGMYIGARGSAASSLVGYGMGITDVDPVEYGLAFERFLNPERVEMPDVDLDIQDDRRDELIQYVCEKYGSDHVGQIATFGSLKARAAVRDCGRVLGMDLAEVDRICKMIPTVPVGITLEQALAENPELKQAYDGSRDVRRLLDTARKLEGLNRNVGVHAAGVLISDDPLTDHVPVQTGGKGELVAQMDKEVVKKTGLLKMDFLGLANLTILANAIENVRRHRGIDIEIMAVPLDDTKTFEMLASGDTDGVFQLEGAGMRRNVIELKPNSVRELAAIVALYRPGPMAFIPKFVRSKFGQEPITYLHPALESILEETYGVICYQEQVLKIAQAIGGFTLGQADVLRKAMSSKNREIMDKQREKFLDGAKANGVPEKTAIRIYEQVEPFAGYAFNKAHAVCYAFLAYRTAYLKANYPAEYYAALLTANMDDKEKLALYIEDCRRLEIDLLPPDINSSSAVFEVEKSGIRFGLAAVKGCGSAVAEGIVQARGQGGAFTTLFDFCERVSDYTQVNKGALEALVQVGAMSSLSGNRAQLVAMLPDAVNWAACRKRDQANGQVGLFGDEMGQLCPTVDLGKYAHITEYPREELLALEKDLTGLYLSGHPLDEMRRVLDQSCTANASSFRDLENDSECVVGGIVADVRYRITRRGDKMAFVRLEDLYGTIPVTFFPNTCRNCEKLLLKGEIVLIKGKASHRERIAAGDDGDTTLEVEIVGESVSLLRNSSVKANGNGNGCRCLHIRINGGRVKLDLLHSLLEAYPGDSPVCFWMCHGGARQKVSTNMSVDASPRLVAELERILGKDVVRLV